MVDSEKQDLLTKSRIEILEIECELYFWILKSDDYSIKYYEGYGWNFGYWNFGYWIRNSDTNELTQDDDDDLIFWPTALEAILAAKEHEKQ